MKFHHGQVAELSGVRVECAGTGLSAVAIALMKNVTPEAQEAQARDDQELKRTLDLEEVSHLTLTLTPPRVPFVLITSHHGI